MIYLLHKGENTMITKAKFTKIISELYAKLIFRGVICVTLLDTTGANIMLLVLFASFIFELWANLKLEGEK